MTPNDVVTAVWIFILGLIFSLAGWMNKRSKSEMYSDVTSKQTKIEASTHTFIGGGLSVVLYAVAQHYFPEWHLMLQGSMGVIVGSLLSEAVIKFAERKINNG